MQEVVYICKLQIYKVAGSSTVRTGLKRSSSLVTFVEVCKRSSKFGKRSCSFGSRALTPNGATTEKDWGYMFGKKKNKRSKKKMQRVSIKRIKVKEKVSKSKYKKYKSKRKSRKFGSKNRSMPKAMYQDPMFGFKPAIEKLPPHLSQYFEYDRIRFPGPGGIREEVGTGYKNVPVRMGRKVSGPYYSSYNV